MGLPKNKRDLLREYVGHICEICKKHEKECGTLEPHRIQRGVVGGRYIIRNILMICSTCHKTIHSNEPK